MHVQTHLAASWMLGSVSPQRRDRRLVAWAGVLPDLDALTVLFGTDAYARWHHVLTHGLVAGIAVTIGAAALARARLRTALLALAAFHLHLMLDLVGSGVGWTISYLYPLSVRELGVTWGWELASWQNVLATLILISYSLGFAVTKRRSFVEAWMPSTVDSVFCDLVARTWARVTGAKAQSSAAAPVADRGTP